MLENSYLNAQVIEAEKTPGGDKPPVGGGIRWTPTRLDWHNFPAYRGEDRYNQEPKRLTGRSPETKARLKMIGNAVVPHQVLPVYSMLYDLWINMVRESWQGHYEQVWQQQDT